MTKKKVRAFTDRDLEKLKQFPTDKEKALLARLEAAEKVCLACEDVKCDPTEIEGMEDLAEAYIAWQKAAGR